MKNKEDVLDFYDKASKSFIIQETTYVNREAALKAMESFSASENSEFKKENEALKEELNYINKVADVSLKSALSIATERDEYKQEIERLKGLIEQLMSGDKLKIVRNSEGNYTAIFNPENL